LICEKSLFFKKLACCTAGKPSGGLCGLSGGYFDVLKIPKNVVKYALYATDLIVSQQSPDPDHRNADGALRPQQV
jgi:hypothetical protein